MTSPQPKDVPVFVLCGGLGTRLREETEFKPKPMVRIGEQPILWHILKTYSSFGFRRFILCMGYKSEIIRDYFLNFYAMHNDATVRLTNNAVDFHTEEGVPDWEIVLAYTGELTMTGGRIAKAAARYLGDSEHFAVTYGDGLTDADLGAEYRFHLEHDKLATVLAVNPPSRFGELLMKDERLASFVEKPKLSESWINGGFFFFRREFRNYLRDEEGCVLEQDPLSQLAREDQLTAYRHTGFWACMDTHRDLSELTSQWNSRKAAWTTNWQAVGHWRIA
jgi:glucose-1-phosphate cytidylyltransferase